jgi:Golgi phosphoprotein 3
MSSTGGLSRRRAAGTADSTYSSPTTSSGPSFGNDAKAVASDPRDLQMEDENKTQPRLTLMEEVLLMGLKDKQVTTKLSSLGNVGREREKQGSHELE